MTGWTYPTAFSWWGDEEAAAIARVLASGKFTMGAEVEAFEREFAAFHGMKHGVMVNSGSSANLVAVAALFNKEREPLQRPGFEDKIRWDGNGSGRSDGNIGHQRLPQLAIAPALAWSTTYAPLVQHGMDLWLADCDDTWNAPVPSLLPQHAKLVVACSILGNPGYLREWKEAAEKLGAYLIEDNCESFMAWQSEVPPRLAGTSGIMNTFSFFYSHQVSAVEGGMVLTNDDECAKLCRMLRAHGWTRDVQKPEAFDDEYDFALMGYNVRPLELHAAVAREQLVKSSAFRAGRLLNKECFRSLTENMPITIPRQNGGENPFSLHFLCDSKEARSRLATALRAEGVDCRLPTGGSFTKHKYGKAYVSRANPTPAADDVHDRGLFLGNAPFTIFDKIELAVSVMGRVLK